MRVVTAGQMREIDNRAIHEWGIPGMVLMENAAKAVVNEVTGWAGRGRSQNQTRVLILAGKGNNGGDGLAAARHLQVMEWAPVVYLFADPQALSGDALLNYTLYTKMAGQLCLVRNGEDFGRFCLDLANSPVVVDALYGTGFSGELPEEVKGFIQKVNAAPAGVVAVDIPSGLDAQSGQAAAEAVRADVTVTFGLPKLGHFLGDGPDHTGRLVIDKISLPNHIIDASAVHTSLITAETVREILPRRSRQGHKGTHGCGLLIGGSMGMSGAVTLAGRAALRCGTGLVQIITPACIASIVDAGIPEATVWPSWPQIDSETMDGQAWNVIEERLASYGQRASSSGQLACAVGPGLKQPPEFADVLRRLLRQRDLPLILDADALNLLAANKDLLREHQTYNAPCHLILTPHPGEMARLCGITVADVQHNRLGLALRKAQEWNAVVVLKGPGTIVASPEGKAAINTSGNSGLGTGGTGDVLTGCLLAWLAQGLSPFDAASSAVYLHGRGADYLARNHGSYGFTATEVADALSTARYELESGNVFRKAQDSSATTLVVSHKSDI